MKPILLLTTLFAAFACPLASVSGQQESEFKYLRFDKDYFTENGMRMYLEIQQGRIRSLEEELTVVDQMILRRKMDWEKAVAEVESLRKKMVSVGSTAGFEEVGKDLAKRKTLLEIELVGAKARQSALLEAAKKIDKTGRDAAAKKFELLREIYMQKKLKLERLVKLGDQGAVSTQAITEAKTEVTKAEIDMLEQRQQLVLAAGDVSNNEQLLAVSIDIAQVAAQLSLVEKKLAVWDDVYPAFSRMVEYRQKIIPLHLEQVRELESKRSDMQQQIAVETTKLKRKKKEFEIFLLKKQKSKDDDKGSDKKSGDK